ncbi:hypothetical protein SNE40_009666 [Patella caerulea]|uniref:Integrase catalytic domain-containing protein n=1 Tax=Patella caerulea TaxID=87958 RepID=A0AAN8PS23_PATCE
MVFEKILNQKDCSLMYCVLQITRTSIFNSANSTIPDLPAARVSSDPPFTNTGLDFAGPLHSSDLGENSKTYVCLFTCASTRAVHFELTRDLSVPSFLLAFRRFSSQRGLPSRLLSDNAKTFKCAQSFINKILRSEEISNYFVNKQVIWGTIVETAPWWGGFWESLAKSLKRCLKKTIGRSTLKFEELRTLLVEIETTLNNRPLTYVDDDQNGVSYALTPADLLYGHRIATTPNARQYDIISTNQSLTKRAKYQLRLLTNFTNQWKKEYLTSLFEYSTNRKKENTMQLLKLGDIVILKNDHSPRIWWKLAKVVALVTGRDNFILSAKVQVLNAKNTNLPPTRPIQHLIPLEVNQTD